MTAALRALDELMALAGLARPDGVVIEEGAPALATRFEGEAACAAALAAAGAMAAEILRVRRGEAQAVRVSTREAAANLASFLHNRFDDPALAPDPRPRRLTPANGFFRAGDGRLVYLHQSFPESAAGLHALMGWPADEEAAARAALRWNAHELEEAIAKRGLCGAVARTPAEWDASEQGRTSAATPVVEIARIGDSAPEPFALDGEAPLAGLRVLDLTRVLAGPACAKALAALGANCLHITSPALPTVEMFVADVNPGKRSAWLDLKSGEARGRLENLVRGADVFSQGYRTGALERLGFGPSQLARLRPGIVCIEINAYGHAGPWRDRPGWEQLAQTATGMALAHGEQQGADRPLLQPAAVNDYTTGYLAAFGALAALERRARLGGSYRVTVSLARTAMWVRSLGLTDGDSTPLTEAEIDGWRITTPSGYGPMRRLRFPVRLLRTPANWTLPAARLGADPPDWGD